MEYLQYSVTVIEIMLATGEVLNLIINGIPSILIYYKLSKYLIRVLNLIINGIPSILKSFPQGELSKLQEVLNLIINGIPSIRK